MANEKKNIKELVSDDDDPTAELELIDVRAEGAQLADVERESDASTWGFGNFDSGAPESGDSIPELRSNLETRARTIGRLQYDIEQLRAKWLGLETEIKAREDIVSNLSRDVDNLKSTISRKDKLLRKRDQSIKSLKTEIRQRDKSQRSLEKENAELERELADYRQTNSTRAAELERSERQLASVNAELDSLKSQPAPEKTPVNLESAAINETQAQLARTEEYADTLRRKLQDLIETQSELSNDRDRLERLIAETRERNRYLSDELAVANESIDELKASHEQLATDRQQEIRRIRFELGEAQNTVAQTNELNNQLASDLMDTRGFKEELERMLCDNEAQSQERIKALEKELRKLTQSTEDYEDKIDTKNTAINVLLGELAKKSEQIDSIGEIKDVIHEIDGRISERFDDHGFSSESEEKATPAYEERDRLTRVLVGKIDKQELRFPLFKNRLTIGRAEENDIQLNVSYISRRHAVVITEGESTRVIDWGSKNGVYVNSERVKEHFLSNGDILSVGNAKFRYEERPKRDA